MPTTGPAARGAGVGDAATGAVLSFAYGSNMLAARLRQRVPGARLLGPAMLPGHGLRWHKAGADGSGKCDVVASPHEQVHGVLWLIPQAQKALLDAAEGLGQGYTERRLTVLHAGREHLAWTYCALQVQDGLLPYAWYHALVLAGAREQGLPAAYCAALAAQAVRPDPDAGRDQRHRLLLPR